MFIVYEKESKRIVDSYHKRPVAVSDTLDIAEVESVQEVFNGDYLTYDNGSVVYHENPNKEKIAKQKEIAELKQKLTATDYQAIKYAEGLIPDEEYAVIKSERQTWRDRINELEIDLVLHA